MKTVLPGIAIVLGLLLLAACVTAPTIEIPAGFAPYRDSELPSAVSPDGVAFRLRRTANEPVQTLEFWAAALERHLTETGYLLASREDFAAPAGPGVSFEWLAPMGEEDWYYLVAIVVSDDDILIGEAAGPVARYREHRASILDAVVTISVADR